MKIYCARRSSSDKAIIDSFVGKDAWVKVLDGKTPLYIQFLEKTGSQYKIHMIAAYWIENGINQWDKDEVDGIYTKSILLNALSRTYEANEGFVVVRPLEILTTDEIKSYLSEYKDTGDEYLPFT